MPLKLISYHYHNNLLLCSFANISNRISGFYTHQLLYTHLFRFPLYSDEPSWNPPRPLTPLPPRPGGPTSSIQFPK
jgi:hypothetical protein